MRVLIAPVGEQPTPNLIPLFAARQQLGSAYEYVQYLVSRDERINEVANHLCQALAQDPDMQGLEIAPLLSMDAWNLTKARQDCATAIRKAIEYAHKRDGDTQVTVNLTGGTKIMSLAAYQAACEAQVSMVYVNTAQSEIIQFGSDGNPLVPHSFKVVISIQTQLRAAGKEFKKCPQRPIQRPGSVPQDRAAFVKWLVSNYDAAYEHCLKRMIFEARQTRKPWQQEVQYAFEPKGKGLDAVQRLEAMGLLRWNTTQRSLRVVDEPAWGFMNGGWVETFALISLAESNWFDEVLGNLEVEGFEGEIDTVVTRNGRLGIVECKTKGPQGEGATFAAAKIRQHEMILGGPYARTFFALPSNENIEDIQKASTQFGIGDPIYEDPQKGIRLKDLPRKVYEGLSS